MNEREIAELRVFALSMESFLPVLEKRKAAAFGQLLQRFNANEDVIRDLAKVNAINELEMEIRGKLRTFENLSKENK
jgi:hypothetical protein